MSRTVEVRLWDDLSEPKTVEATTSVTVGLDGDWAELDLTAENAEMVRDIVRSYMKAGHESGGASGSRPARKGSREASRIWWDGLREYYAREHGHTANPGEYVPADVRRAYEKIAGPPPPWRRR